VKKVAPDTIDRKSMKYIKSSMSQFYNQGLSVDHKTDLS